MNESLLRAMPLFAFLPDEELPQLAATLRQVDVPPHTVIMREGDRGDRCYIVLAGQLEIVKALGTTDERVVGIARPGEFVGEMSLLSYDKVRTASARTSGPVQLLELTLADLDVLLQRHPNLAYEVLRIMSARLRDTQEATIRDLQAKNLQLTQAYADLQASQARIIEDERRRARLEEELRVARLTQQQLLPRELPKLPGWQVTAHYQPAGAVGGDFYDFVELSNGLMGIMVGDVSNKGIPAALVMASTHSLLRSEAQRLTSPSAVLERVNAVLCQEIPANMFVTCLYGVLNPGTGLLRLANAGHNFPYVRSERGVVEMRATGMPLGLMPDMRYETKEVTLAIGESVLLYSDGIVEAHNPRREMFGFPRLQKLLADLPAGSPKVVEVVLDELVRFAGSEWEQEDDISLVTLRRS